MINSSDDFSPESNERAIPHSTKRLFDFGTESPPPVEAKQEMDDPAAEANRIVKRLAAIVEDHRNAATALNIDLDAKDLKSVIYALKEHAKGKPGLPVPNSRDEIHQYCLNRLFEELVEEPSNILFTTQKGNDTVRYDAMNDSFWIQCLDLMEAKYND